MICSTPALVGTGSCRGMPVEPTWCWIQARPRSKPAGSNWQIYPKVGMGAWMRSVPDVVPGTTCKLCWRNNRLLLSVGRCD
jgi:hypothetical protein